MRRPLVLRIGIPKSDDKPHRFLSSRLPFERRALLFLFAFFAFVALLRLGLGFGFGGVFAFHFFLALLYDFWLCWRWRFPRRNFRRILFFDLQRHHRRQH